MKLGSLFDGAGTCPYAATLCGVTPVWSSEIEPFPVAVTAKRFPTVKQLGDITKINGAEIEPVDIITFGSPCQDLSIAGKGKGMKKYCPECRFDGWDASLTFCPECSTELESTRSGLFMEAVRIFKEMRAATDGKYPRFVMWENVPGAFSSNKGEDFRTVLEEICKVKDSNTVIPRPKKWSDAGEILADEYSVAWRVLDAQFWGVPQRRRRIFLVADFGGQCAGKISFEREGLRWNPSPSRTERQGITADTQSGFGAESSTIAFSFDSLSSNSMKSSNPISGCNQVDIAKCVDTTNPCPSKNQGGIAILQSAGFNGHKSITGSIQYAEETAPTIESNMPSNVLALDCRNLVANEVSATLQAKESGGSSLNFINPVFCSYKAFGEYQQSEIGKSIMACDDITTGDLLVEDYIARRLMPVECARLQGMPDDWCEDVKHSDTAEYKMWGNGMALPCVMYVMEGLAEAVAVRIFEDKLRGLL